MEGILLLDAVVTEQPYPSWTSYLYIGEGKKKYLYIFKVLVVLGVIAQNKHNKFIFCRYVYLQLISEKAIIKFNYS